MLEGIVRALAPQVCSLSSLRDALRSVLEDRGLWAELDASRPLQPVRRAATTQTSSVIGAERV